MVWVEYTEGQDLWDFCADFLQRESAPGSVTGLCQTGATTMWARGISEFGAVVILAYHPKIVPVLVFERFEGFGLDAAQPVAALLIIVALLTLAVLRLALLPMQE
jgi:ABC-type sulfate transport system permease component